MYCRPKEINKWGIIDVSECAEYTRIRKIL